MGAALVTATAAAASSVPNGETGFACATLPTRCSQPESTYAYSRWNMG